MSDELAESLIDDDKFDDAIKRYELLLERAEDNGHRLRLASCFFKIGKVGDALASARLVAEKENEHQEDAFLLIGFCLRSLKRWRECAKIYIAFTQKFPNSDRRRIALFSAALCLEELDDWDGAIDIYKEIKDEEGEFRQAICLERSGRNDEATALFEEFIRRHEDSPEMLKVRFKLGSMRLRQGKLDEAIEHLQEAARIGADNFVGKLAETLIEKAKTRKGDLKMKMKSYNN